MGTTTGVRGSRSAKPQSAARATLTPGQPGVGRMVVRGAVRGRWMAGASAGLGLDLLHRDAVTPRQFLARRLHEAKERWAGAEDKRLPIAVFQRDESGDRLVVDFATGPEPSSIFGSHRTRPPYEDRLRFCPLKENGVS